MCHFSSVSNTIRCSLLGFQNRVRFQLRQLFGPDSTFEIFTRILKSQNKAVELIKADPYTDRCIIEFYLESGSVVKSEIPGSIRALITSWICNPDFQSSTTFVDRELVGLPPVGIVNKFMLHWQYLFCVYSVVSYHSSANYIGT